MSNRSISLDTDEGTIARWVNNGLLLGGTLSSILLNLYTVALHKTSTLLDTDMVQFADNCKIMVKGVSLEDFHRKSKLAADKFIQIADELEMKVKYEKIENDNVLKE